MYDKLTLETELVVLGRALSLETGVHWDEKKALKFDISLLFTKIGGIRSEGLLGFSFH